MKIFYFIHVVTLVFVGITAIIYLILKNKLIESPKEHKQEKEMFAEDAFLFHNQIEAGNSEFGFGFFAPNVHSRQILFFESCGETFALDYETFAGKLRSKNLVNNTLKLFNATEKSNGKPIQDLLLQELANKVRKENFLPSSCRNVKVTYKILEFPSLQDKSKQTKPELISIKDWYYETE